MQAKRPESKTLRSQTLNFLRSEIINGSMYPGMVIREVELAQQLGISTIPLREALIQLAEEGLVLMEPNKSKTVAPLSKKDLIDIFSVYRVLSSTGLSWGFDNLDEEKIKYLKKLLDDQEISVKNNDWDSAISDAMKFTFVIYEASGNKQLCKILTRMSQAIQRVSLLIRSPVHRNDQLDFYKKMLDCIIESDKKRFLDLYSDLKDSFEPFLYSLPYED